MGFSRLKEGAGDTSLENKKADLVILEVQVAKTDETAKDVHFSSLGAENMFASLHGLLRADYDLQEHISFEIVSSKENGIKFYVTAPSGIVKFVESQIYAQYPEALIKVVQDYTPNASSYSSFEVMTFSLMKNQFFPIKTFRDFETDPLSGILSVLAELGDTEQVWFQLLVKPMPDIWQKEGYDYINSLRSGAPIKQDNLLTSVSKGIAQETGKILVGTVAHLFSPPPDPAISAKAASSLKSSLTSRLSGSQELELKAIENKLSKMGFEVLIRIAGFGNDNDRVKNNLRSITASFRQFATSNMNGFIAVEEPSKKKVLNDFINRSFEANKSFVLNSEELATFYHLPSRVETPNISWVYSKKSEPPATLPIENCTYIGETIFRNKKARFGLANTDDRLRHMYLIGKTGTGKSTMLELMIAQDIINGEGVAVLDPHGETIDHVLERIPDNRVNDVIIFDPSDVEKPVGLNLLEIDDPSQKNLMASALVAAIHHHFDYSWGPRLEYLLNYCILTLLEVPGTSMLGITRLMEDDNYRRYILHKVKDPVTVKFWENEFKEMKGNQKLVTEAIAPIQNKVNRFLASTTIRNILGQKKSTVDIWEAMNSGKILLMNLSKGKIGADNANLLGALLVSRIQFMALQRAKLSYEQRRPFYLYVDEFQNFATGSFEEILSESRKYRLGLYLTHQFTAQLPEPLLKAVFGNVGTIAAFSLGAPDARVLASEFAPYFDESDIISLERFHIYIKLMINGMTSLPFSAKILLPWEENVLVPKTSNKERVIELSRQKYGVDRAYVEDKINKWVETPFDKGMAIAQEFKERDFPTPPNG